MFTAEGGEMTRGEGGFLEKESASHRLEGAGGFLEASALLSTATSPTLQTIASGGPGVQHSKDMAAQSGVDGFLTHH